MPIGKRRTSNLPTTGPQTGTGRKAVGSKPQMGAIVQRGAGGKILVALTKKLWGN